MRRVSIASVVQRNWSVICVRAGPVVSLSLSFSLSLSLYLLSLSLHSTPVSILVSTFFLWPPRPSSRWFFDVPLGPFTHLAPSFAARPVQIDILHTVRGAGYTYSNTVLQWSYQWGKQKLVCKRTCLTANRRRPPRSGSYSGSRCDREPRGSSHVARAPTLSTRDTQDERQQMEHRGAAPDQQEHQ